MAHEREATSSLDGALEQVLAGAFAGAGRVVLVGEADEVARLEATRPARFVRPEAVERSAPEPYEVLALASDDETLARAVRLARDIEAGRVFVLLEGGALEGAGESLHRAGLALAGAERIFWARAEDGPRPAGSRAERLAAETRAILVRGVLTDHPGAVTELEEAIARLQAELDVRAQLEVDHARTREAERHRAERLQQLERVAAVTTAAELESEVVRLRGELEQLQATRIWRVGQRYWRLRDRVRAPR
jgi:hypothetical protein